jgi:hypothetical protein
LANGERDLWLAGASALVAAIALTLAFGLGKPREDASTPTVAAVKQASGQIKLRPALTLGWRGAARGNDVHDGDAIFVPPGAEATIAFLDGTELALDERSLVVIERPKAGVRSVSLRQGSVSGRAGTDGLTLTTPAGEAHLDARSEARVELTGKTLEVSVKTGTAEVKGKGGPKSVGRGQRVEAADTGTTELAPWAVDLTSPEARAQFPFRSEPQPVTLAWTGAVPSGARVQVARDRLFAFVEHELAASGGEVVLTNPSRGVNWWRVVDERGQALSESRRFTCSEDVAPVAMFPRLGEVLLAPPGTEVAFAWAPLAGITRYRLERSEERRVGKECRRLCRSRWSPYH